MSQPPPSSPPEAPVEEVDAPGVEAEARASPRVLQEWAARVAAEYTSAATTARLVHLEIALGLPQDLIERGLDIVRDELDHARLGHDCLRALGGRGVPVELSLDTLLPASTEGPLAEATLLVLRAFCFGETLAVPLFQALRTACAHPAARPVLDRILQDEARHRAYGWTVLDALLALDPPGVHSLAQDRISAIRDHFRATYATFAASQPPTAAEQRMGLMPTARWAEVFETALRQDVAPRFARRGLRLLPSETLG